MGFSERDKLIALAIVHIFETSKPFGDYSAVAVLNDGAGVSYGINQFTHKSGSLEAVLRRFHILCERAGTQKLLEGYERKLNDRSVWSIRELASDQRFKNGLRAAAHRAEMQRAQREIAFEKYLKPALDACVGSAFRLPMSLAVIYDSINHGSYEKIRDRVLIDPPRADSLPEFEKKWITKYVQTRDAWLESIPRLKATAYRTDFFLAQIGRGNWTLDLPVFVHGFRLTDAHIDEMLPEADNEEEIEDSAAAPAMDDPQTSPTQGDQESPQQPATERPPPPAAAVEVVDAPPPTGFVGKLKKQIAGLGIGAGTLAVIKEWTGIQLSPETVELLKVLLPTVLGLGFLGFLAWYISEKVVGFKTLKLQSEIATDPTKHNLKIRPQ